MNIETGIFTAITSGYYTITFSARADVHPDEYSFMYLYHNGAKVNESMWETYLGGGDTGVTYMADQGSRTVILHLMVGDTVDLRTKNNSDGFYATTLCLYMAP